MTTTSDDDARVALESRRELWRRGACDAYLLDEAGPTGGQRAWLRMLNDIPPGRWAALEVSRQRGKTFTVLAWLFQSLGLRCQRGVFLAQTGANSLKIVDQFIKDVGNSFPPEWGVELVDGEARFANGSEVAVFGTDNAQFRRSRGRNAHKVVLSEAGFYASLAEVESVYIPQLQTTGGVGVYESSPAENPAHDFSKRCDASMAVGRYVRDTFWSNPRIDHESIIRGEMERLHMTREELFASTAFRREFLAQRVTEETRAAVPAWTDEAAAELVGDWVRPEHFDGYVSADPGGGGDPHATLFGYHDPSANCVVIEDELELRSATAHVGLWAQAIRDKEAALWGVDRWEGTLSGATREWLVAHRLDGEFLRVHSETAPRQPYLRVGDNDPTLTRDMALQHGLAVLPSEKHDKWVWVDTLNQLIRERRVRIHPRCVRLLEQLRSTLWNRTRSQWERTDRDHGDLVDCLVYLVRNVVWSRDCRPAPPVDRGLMMAQQVVQGRTTGLEGLRRLR
jgi:hypothetical protein